MTVDACRHVVISGCSGGGKSTLLAELARRGFATVPEPGRRIVREELEGDGRALPWVDPIAFARRAIDLAIADRLKFAAGAGWVFFDRGLIDAAAALQHVTGESAAELLSRSARFHRQVFLTPPWPRIYHADPERRHGLDEARAEYDRLLLIYRGLGYKIFILPKASNLERANLLLARLGAPMFPSGEAGRDRL